MPSSNSTFPKKEEVRCLKPLSKSIEILTPNVKARATVYSQTVKATDVSQGHIKSCASCKKSHDQHLLAHCDTCKLHYHLGCLTPPLTRMPKKSGHYGWSCSECYPDSSDSNPNVGDVYDDDIEGGVDAATQKRNRKRRLAASKGENGIKTTEPYTKEIKSDISSSSTTYSSSTNSLKKPSHSRAKKSMSTESTKKLYEAASNAATALLSKQGTSILSIDDSNNSTDVSKVAKAAAKAERKQIKKAEKERRKMEKKKRKILEKQQQQMQGVCLKSILAII